MFGFFLVWGEIVWQVIEHEERPHALAYLHESHKIVEHFQGRCVVRKIIEPQQHIVNRGRERFRTLGDKQARFEVGFLALKLVGALLSSRRGYAFLYRLPYAVKRRVDAAQLLLDDVALWFLFAGFFGFVVSPRLGYALAHVGALHGLVGHINDGILYEIAPHGAPALAAAIVVIRRPCF